MRFKQATYRRSLEKEPEQGADAMFYVEIIGGTQGRPFFGGGQTVRNYTVSVRVAYWRSADRRIAHHRIIDDMIRIVDLAEDPLLFSSDVTGIRSVTAQPSSKVVDKPKVEIWETRFAVEWQQVIS